MPNRFQSFFPTVEDLEEEAEEAQAPELEPAEEHARPGWLDIGLEAATTLYFIGSCAGCLSLLFGGWAAVHPMTPVVVVGAVCHARRRPLTWKLALLANGVVATWFLSIGVTPATHRWLGPVPAAASETDFTLAYVLIGMAATAIAGMLLRKRSRFIYGMIPLRSVQDR